MIESTGSMGRTATYAEELLVAEVTRLRQELSLAEEGLANYEEENERLHAALSNAAAEAADGTRYAEDNERLREAFRRLRLGICLHATDTVWAGPAETAVDFITRHLADEWTEQSLSEPQPAEHT